jgi:hypothetical protein
MTPLRPTKIKPVLTRPRREALQRLLTQETPVGHTAIAVELATLRSLQVLGLVERSLAGWQLTSEGHRKARALFDAVQAEL